MKNKPFYLKVFPFLSLAIAASFPVQIHLLYRVPLEDYNKILSMLTPLNLMTMASLVIAAAMTFMLNKWIYKVIPLLLFVTFANNAIVGLYGTDYTLVQVCLSFILLAISLKPFYHNEIKAVIFNPKLRWWETPKRYAMRADLQLNSAQFRIDTQSLNFSKTGAFAAIESNTELDTINIDDILDFTIKGEDEIHLRAKVVRINQGHEVQPDGIGLEFIKDEGHSKNYMPWFKESVANL